MSSLGFNFLPWVGLTMGEVHCILFFRTTKINWIRVSESTVEHTPPPNFTQVHDMHPPPPNTHTHTHTHIHTHPPIDYQNLSIAIGDGKRGEASFYE